MSVKFVEATTSSPPLREVRVDSNSLSSFIRICRSTVDEGSYLVELFQGNAMTYMYVPLKDMIQAIEGIRRLV